MSNEQPTTLEAKLAAIRERRAKISPTPWSHFYPEHREARSGVIRFPRVDEHKVGNVTIDGGSASGLRYQVEGHRTVNGEDRWSVALITAPRSRNTGDWDGIGREASVLAHAQVRADGEFIAHAPKDIDTLLAAYDEQRRVNALWFAEGSCSVCGGQPLASGLECVCEGRGTRDAEFQGLRLECLNLQSQLAALALHNEPERVGGDE